MVALANPYFSSDQPDLGRSPKNILQRRGETELGALCQLFTWGGPKRDDWVGEDRVEERQLERKPAILCEKWALLVEELSSHLSLSKALRNQSPFCESLEEVCVGCHFFVNHLKRAAHQPSKMICQGWADRRDDVSLGILSLKRCYVSDLHKTD